MRDAAAALVSDGRIVAAAEEERFVRQKHVTALPVHAIRYCLREAGVALRDVDALAVPWKYWLVGRRARLAVTAMLRSPQLFRVKGARSLERVSREWMELFRLSRELTQRVGAVGHRPVFLDHHLCHAASSFLVSPFERSAILVVDGASEADTTLMAMGEGSEITVLDRTPLPHSLGQFYAAMTAFLGFRPDHDEYIVMGLAASGEPTFAQVFRREIVRLLPLGRFELNTRLLDFHLARAGLFVKEFIHLFGAPRQPSDELTQRHRDLAASAQLVLEEVLLHLGRHLRTLTGQSLSAWRGGWPTIVWRMVACVPNSDSNGSMCRRLRETPVRHSGRPVWWSARRGGTNNRPQMPSAYWGPQFEEDACRAALERERLAAEPLSDEQLYERVATELARGRLVFWFQGRMEWGPRALGNRSLLADPRREDMRELINSKVKCREPFRPFAPSVLDERAQEFFDLPAASPFMQFTVRVKASAKGIIPAVTHVDGTARVQTVTRETNPRFYDLLATFGRLTGVPVLLNTSFNVQEPIVCSPEDAVRCFLRTQVEWLVLGNLLVKQPSHQILPRP